MESPSNATERGPIFLAIIGATALVEGLLVWLLTIAASRSRLSGNGWSLSGNGALIVPFGIGPALIAGGWAAIVLLSLLSLILFGGSGAVGATASVLFEILGILWLFASPLIAVLMPTSAISRRPMRLSRPRPGSAPARCPRSPVPVRIASQVAEEGDHLRTPFG